MSEPSPLAKYDITNRISKYLDRHLVIPLLQFLETKQLYPKDALLKARIQLLEKTKMVDFVVEIVQQAEGDNSEKIKQLEKQRAEVIAEFEELTEKTKPILEIIKQTAIVNQLKMDKVFTMQYLVDNYDEIKMEHIDLLYKLAKLQFDIGDCQTAADYLFHYIPLSAGCPDQQENLISALWGKFASEILLGSWDNALADMNRLKEVIDQKNFGSPLEQLQQRTWLIHWSLFVFFNHPQGKAGVLELFFNDKYLNAIQTTCPHILRYLTAAVITNKTRSSKVKDMVRVLTQEQYSYNDPITDFLKCLFVNFDFDGAQQKLLECEDLLANDFFLVACRDEFIENARLFIFETYCRIHQCIDIKMLANKLNMEESAAEKWIVNLIRNAKFDAKIDSANGHVIMGTKNTSIYQQVIEKTRLLSYRTQVMSTNVLKSDY